MAYYPGERGRRGHNLLLAPTLAFLIVAGLAGSYIAFTLWPRWPGSRISLQSPALPVVIGGTMFNIEPAAIRQPLQRRPGTQDRVDLAYLWPSLAPPDPTAKPDLETGPANPNERLFLTLADGRDELAPFERVKTIYPRYLGAEAKPKDGLAVRPFRDGTPYNGEDLISDAGEPDAFMARCTRSGIGNTGMCLFQRRVGGADVTARFPRDWLNEWEKVSSGISRVIARLHPDG
jgi:hypothetical protein